MTWVKDIQSITILNYIFHYNLNININGYKSKKTF